MAILTSRFAEQYAGWVIRYRWLVIALALASAVALGAGLPGLSFSNSYRVFFSPENPQLRAFESLEHVYTKNDFLLFALRPAAGDVFTRETLAAVAWLTEHGWKIPYASRVDSLTNFQHSRADVDSLAVDDLVPDPSRLTETELADIKTTAMAEPLLYHRMIATDARTTGVSVRLYLPGKSRTEVVESATSARALVAEFRRLYPTIRIELTGTAMLSVAFAEAPRSDSRTLFPLMGLSLILAMFFFLRSVSAVFATVVLVLCSVAAALGAAGWCGVQLNSASAIAPLIVMTLAVADAVHLLMTLFEGMEAGQSKPEALAECLRVNVQPIFLTTLTTVIGFLGLNTSDAPPLRDLGNITGFGVAVAWLYSMALLPALILVLPTRVHVAAPQGPSIMERLAEWVIRHHRNLLRVGGSLVLVLSLLVTRLEINDRPVQYFHRDNDFRRGTEFVVDHLTGFYGFNLSLGAGQSGGISDPQFLAKVDAFSEWLRSRPEVVHVSTITDTFKRLNRNLHGDDPAYWRLPETRELAAQYLLLYEMSLPYGLDLNDQINVDKSATRMSVLCGDIDFRDLKRLKAEAEQWLRDNGLPSMRAEGSSPAVMFAYIGERSILSMAQGTVTSFFLISLVLIFTLRSLRIGTLSLIPNVIPISVAFGLWYLFVGSVDFAVSVVASVSLGIIDDNTVHFLTDYLRGRRDEKLGCADAIRYAFRTVGRALWANSAILVFGFAAMSFSAFWPNATLGLLTGTVIALAIAADFLLVPPLLLWLDGDDTK